MLFSLYSPYAPGTLGCMRCEGQGLACCCADQGAGQCQCAAPACDREVWDHFLGCSAGLEHGCWPDISVGCQVSPPCILPCFTRLCQVHTLHWPRSMVRARSQEGMPCGDVHLTANCSTAAIQRWCPRFSPSVARHAPAPTTRYACLPECQGLCYHQKASYLHQHKHTGNICQREVLTSCSIQVTVQLQHIAFGS